METLQALLIEQTSPVEVLLFIGVTVILFLVAAGLFYFLLLALLWTLQLRQSIPLHRLILPTRKQFRDYAGEYLLATATSLLLITTMIAKHDLVEELRSYSIDSKLLASPGVEQLFPLREPPEELRTHLEKIGSVSVHALVGPLLEIGRVAEVRFFVESLVPELRGKSLAIYLDQSHLVVAAVILSVVYLLWLSSGRVSDFRVDPERSRAPAYRQAMARLLVLALCMALLLVAPRLLADTDAIVDSTVAAVRHHPAPQQNRNLAKILKTSVTQQYALFNNLTLLDSGGSAEGNLVNLLADTRGSVRDLKERLNELNARLDRAAQENRELLVELGERVQLLDDNRLRELDRLAQLEEAGQVRNELLGTLGTQLGVLKEGLDARIERTLTQVQGIEARHTEEVDELKRSLVVLREQLGELSRFGDLLADLDARLLSLARQRETTGTLVVLAHPARFGEEFDLVGPDERTFSAPTVLSGLSPGLYRVDGYTEQVRIREGGIESLRVPPPPPPPPVID